jgi:hypothetical protein
VGWLAKKTHSQEVRRNFIAPGCPINDVLDFGGHFLSLGWSGFFKRGSFSTATRFINSYPGRRNPTPLGEQIFRQFAPSRMEL